MFLLQTDIDVSFLAAFQSRLRSSLVQHVALVDQDSRPLIGSWPFSASQPALHEIKQPIGASGLVAAAGYSSDEVWAQISTELLLLSLTYLSSMLAVTALGFAYAFRSQIGTVLRSMVQQKEVLHREAEHRLKGALQLISSVVALQLRSRPSAAAAVALRTVQHRVAAVLAVNSRLGGRVEEGEVELGAYLQLLCEDLGAAFVERRGRAVAGPLAAGADQAARIGLIVNELVVNALRHGFPDVETGEVSVTLGYDQDRFHIQVSDQGVGLITQRAATGSGLALVGLLCEQLGCNLRKLQQPKGVGWVLDGQRSDLIRSTA
jgi:two-component sensor histidine kinase